MEKLKILLLMLMFALSTIGVEAQEFDYTANGIEWRCERLSNGTAVIIYAKSHVSGVVNFPAEVIDNSGRHLVVSVIYSHDGRSYFQNNADITEVNIPASIKGIMDKTFYGCTGLTSVSMPGVEEIGEYAFGDCINLTNVNMASLKKIGDYAFAACNISSIDLTNIESLGKGAFIAAKLTSITWGHHITQIPEDAFSQTLLTSVIIPKEITTIGANAFGHSPKLTSISFQNEGLEGEMTLENGAFAFCTSLRSVTIPGSVKTIGQNAFRGCTSLTEVHLQSGVEVIGAYAFSGCAALSGDLTIPETVKRVNESAFQDCPFGGTLTMKAQRQTEVGYDLGSVFHGNQRLKFSHIVLEGPEPSALVTTFGSSSPNPSSIISTPIDAITIRPSVKKLSPSAFQFANFSKLSSLTIPSSVKEIGVSAFYRVNFSPSLHITIPSSVTKIGELAFSESNLVGLTIKDGGLSEIPFGFCESCINLSQVNLPQGLTKIKEKAFCYTKSLTNIDFPAELTEIEPWAFAGSALTSILLPEGLYTIGTRAFEECSSLANITPLPSTIVRIENYAFAGCPLQGDANMMIPSSLRYIGTDVFDSNGITGEAVFGQLAENDDQDANLSTGNPFVKSHIYGLRLGTYDKYFCANRYNRFGTWQNYSGLLYIDSRDCTIRLISINKGGPNVAYMFTRNTGHYPNAYNNFITASVNTLIYLPSETKFNNSALPTATFDQRFEQSSNPRNSADGENFIMDGKCKYFYVADGLPYRVPIAFTALEAQYDREFNVTIGKAVSTLYLPYPTDLPAGMCAYTLVKKGLDAHGDKAFIFREVPQGTRLSANKPYLVRITDGQPHKLPVMHNVEVPVSPSVESAGQIGIETGDWKFYGTTEKIDNAAAYAKKAYYLNGNKWWAVQDGVENDYIAPFRCFVSSPTGAAASRSFVMVLDGDDDSNVTGINQLESDTEKDMHSGKYPFYSIDGKLMGKDYNKLERGQIYIVNGKKFYKF